MSNIRLMYRVFVDGSEATRRRFSSRAESEGADLPTKAPADARTITV